MDRILSAVRKMRLDLEPTEVLLVSLGMRLGRGGEWMLMTGRWSTLTMGLGIWTLNELSMNDLMHWYPSTLITQK
jgi:hypothetical protein